jgi:hypothetical protein
MKPLSHANLQINHRKNLNEKQTELLIALYKFRFGTPELISQYMEQSLRYTNVRLKILLDQEYIARNYNSSYKLTHKPATYYLLPKSIGVLKLNFDLDPKGLHLQYSNAKVKAAFSNHWLRMFRLYLKLDGIYGEDLDFYTSSEITGQTRFPRPLPDAFLNFNGGYNSTQDCMVELLESTTSLDRAKQRLNRYFAHYELESWGDTPYPRLLLVCDNTGLQRELQRYMTRTLLNRGANISCYISTLYAVLGAQGPATPIWVDVSQPDELVSIHS